MADEEAERKRRARINALNALSVRLEDTASRVKNASECREENTSRYCYEFCQTLAEYASLWKIEEDPLPVLDIYITALLSFAEVSPYLSAQCDKVPVVLERLSLNCIELLMSLPQNVPDALWDRFRSSVQMAHSLVQEKGISQLRMLYSISQEQGMWTNPTLQSILKNNTPPQEKVHELLIQEGPMLLKMRIKHLMKESSIEQAALLAKTCSDFSEFEEHVHFKQTYLVCLCRIAPQEIVMEELSRVDCREALEMICNLEADGDEKAAFTLCSGFLTRQILQEDSYCAWELTLFWGKLLKRFEPSEQGFLDRCRQMSLLSKTVFHLLFFIKVIQSEMDKVGLSTCIDLCIRALRMESCEGNTKATVCKTISCLLPSDLEVKRSCQLTEFLLEPTVDSYYAVETLYNEPDQKLEEKDLPVPNSLRCELILVLKTQWPFDPEFWDWKMLKRHCLGLMGEEASIVSSIDELNDGDPEVSEDDANLLSGDFKDVSLRFVEATNELNEIADHRKKNREMKKLREKGFVSARFRNWQAYMQYCVLCDKEFLGHRIVRHAQTHFKDGLYSCPICLENFDTKETLEPHVASHVKLSCKERLAAMKTSQKLADPKTAAPLIAALKAKSGENQMRTKTKTNCNGDSKFSNGHANGKEPLDVKQGNVGSICPVQSCRKGFKYFCNLIAHVKDHGDNEEAARFLEMQSTKVVCQYCRRQFVSVDHLNDHLQVHCGAKPYICIQLNCKASFDSNTELIVHKKEHQVFKARCMFPGCRKIFHEAYKLYDHEAQHYRTFTCKAPDCGKVFHCQSELDLHIESHITKAEGLSTNGKPPEPHQDSLIELHQVQTDTLSLTNSKSTNPLVDHPSYQVVVKHSVENMLKGAEIAMQGCIHPDTQTPVHQAIPSTNDHLTQTAMSTHLNELGQEDSLLEALMSDSDPMPSTSSYQSVLEDLLPVPATGALHGPLQASGSVVAPIYNNTSETYGQYTPNPLGQVQTQFPSMYNKTMTSPVLASHNATPLVSLGAMVPPVLQTLPCQIAPLPTNGQSFENKPVQPITTNNTLQVVKERHKCPYDTCTRDYSSYRSVTKHMKAVHPDFYTQWKLAKKNNMATIRNLSKKGSLDSSQQDQMAPKVQTQNPSAMPYSKNCVNSSFTSAPPSHMQTNHMANILNPIVISQLESCTNHMTAGHLWDSSNNSAHHPQTCHSQAMTQNMKTLSSSNFTPLPTTASTVSAQHRGVSYSTLHPHLNTLTPAQVNIAQKLNGSSNDSLHSVGNINPPQQVISPNMIGADPKFLPTQMPVISSFTDSVNRSIPKDALAASYPQEPSNSSISSVNHTECVVTLKRDSNLGFPNNETVPSNESSLAPQSNTGIVSKDGNKKVKRSRRTKWPAIIKDGKFICCRCYREFQSPKSLGGHLSKRAFCKPFDEAELTADLPSSFLDLLNSPHPTSSYVNLQLPAHPPIKGPLDPKLFPNVTYPQANGSKNVCSDKTMEEVFKQNPSNVRVSSGQEQQTLQNTCNAYSQNNRMSEASVIQHTDSVKHQLQTSYPDMSDRLFSEGLSDPLLSQLLAEAHSVSTLNRGTADHVGQILAAESANNMEIKEKSTISSANAISNDGLLAAMESLAQNLVSEKTVKEKLREQILAGDLHKKSSLPRGSSLDSSCSQVSVASPVTGEKHCSSNLIQNATQGERKLMGNTPGTSSETVSQLGDANQNESLTHSQSSMKDQNTNMTTYIPYEILEIQKAFEKLDLDREVAEETKTLDPPTGSDVMPNKPESNVSSIEMSSYLKPFACDTNGCTYRAMTKDALFKHLIKLHNYTDDMVAQVKDQFNVAPFRCQKCYKSFTRNSNLRAHYLTVHNFSQEDMRKLKGRHLSVEREGGSPCPMPQLPNQVKEITDASQQVTVTGTPGTLNSDVIKKHFITPPFIQQSPVVPRGGNLGIARQALPLENQTPTNPSVIMSIHSSMAPRVDQHPKTWFPGHANGSPLKELLPTAPLYQNLSAHVKTEIQSLDRRPKPNKPRPPKPKESPKKPKEKKAEGDETFSPYRPYRCVHHGCVAAFTIQHNLILHYKAVHQSVLPKFEVNIQDEQNDEESEDRDRNEETEDKSDGEIKEVDEFWCQVKDCSCIFQTVPDLLQHYLQPHKLSLEKAGTMMCSINLGRFKCDQTDCSETFTDFWKYINHVDREHKNIKISKMEPVEGMFRCQVEGCDCAYSTRSNLLRHTMKKHHDVYKRLLMNPREGSRGGKLGRPRKYDAEDVIEKENRETNKKLIKKACLKKNKKMKNNWTKYGKPILKTQEEASAMCTKRLQLQYACMIKGCETVTGSERNIMKHYLQHGLPKQYLEEQRSYFIYCKKLPRSKYRRIASRSDDTDKSEDSSIETSDNDEVAERELSESEFSKQTSGKESTEDPDLSDSKPSTDTCSEVSVEVKRRRGRPRKGEIVRTSSGQYRTTRERMARNCSVNYVDLNSDSTSSSNMTQEDISDQNTPLNSFKPMGFEVSFLQFLEESRTPKRKATEQINGGSSKRMAAFHLKTATIVCKRSDAELPMRNVLKLVAFKNPQKLTSLGNVTFEVAKVFSGVFELLLKQLHEMRPTVILEKEN